MSNIFYPNRVKFDKYIWWFIIFFTVISGIRGNVGVDSNSYIYIFTHGDLRDDINGEHLFLWFVQFIFNNGIHFSIGLGVCAFAQIYFTVKGLISTKYLLIYVPLVMFGSNHYLSLMNGVRQMIVACVFIYACRYIYEKKMLKYAAFIIVLSFIHHSALMLLPFYFIPKGFKIANKRNILLIIFIVCFIAGMTPQFQSAISSAESMTSFFGYDQYKDISAEFLQKGYTKEVRAFGPMQLSYFLIGVFTIWFGPMLKKRYEGKIEYFNLWFFFSYLYISAYFLVCNVSHLFIRPIMYFQMFHLIITALLVYDLFKQGRTSSQMKLIAILFVMIIWTSTSWDIVKNYNHPRNSITYKTFFLK